MIGRLRRTPRGWGFPLIGWLSAGMYLLVTGGLPLPFSGTVTKDLSVSFPCMNSPCGCHSAEQCWNSCCCHTPAERLAWAREHGITPPQALIVEVDINPNPQPTATCCTHAAQKTCCSTKPAKPSCDSSKGGGCHTSHAVATDKPTVNNTVIGIHAMSCHGFGTDWLASLIAVPPSIVGCKFHPLPTGVIFAPELEFSSAAFPPPVPPPRIAAI